MAESYGVHPVGKPETLEYRVYFTKGGSVISPFHDIPLWNNEEKKIANMVVEIPKGSRPKLEINKELFMNPIKQDIKNGKLRYIAYDYPFNYGAFPQTWENPALVHPATNAKGDNDPVDVVEISETSYKTGEIKQVKILGVWAMIDEGETDWKVLVVDVNHPKADHLNDLEDIDKVFPGKLNEIFDFLENYKVPDGKPKNKFGFDNKPQPKKTALEVVEETHAEWKKLVSKSVISTANVNVQGSPNKISKEEVDARLKSLL